ncbi:uncharacterized protein [Onthophagus taurus]|uniref:uncharacterized protein n=1 Tax=Onthophagus taurus TaxID=166361 RepID=UPI0039BE63B1
MTKKISTVIGLNLSFHHIPKRDNVLPYWVSKCKPNVNLKTDVVCSLHFKPEDFERDLKSELLNLKPKVFLKPTAVPTVKVETSEEENKNSNPSNEFLIIQIPQNVIKVQTKNVACQAGIDRKLTEEQIKYLRGLEKKICHLVLENNDLGRKLKKKELLTAKLRRQVKTLSASTTYLKRKQFRASKSYMNELIREKLTKIFPKGKSNRIIRQINWTEKDFIINKSPRIPPPSEKDNLTHQEQDFLTHREYITTLSREDRAEYLAAWIIDKVKSSGKIKGNETDHTYAINAVDEVEEEVESPEIGNSILLNLLTSSDGCKQSTDGKSKTDERCIKNRTL